MFPKYGDLSGNLLFDIGNLLNVNRAVALQLKIIRMREQKYDESERMNSEGRLIRKLTSENSWFNELISNSIIINLLYFISIFLASYRFKLFSKKILKLIKN